MSEDSADPKLNRFAKDGHPIHPCCVKMCQDKFNMISVRVISIFHVSVKHQREELDRSRTNGVEIKIQQNLK